MKRAIHRKRRVPPGAAPGTLVADPTASEPTIHLIAYGPDDFEEVDIGDPGELEPLLGKYAVAWINVIGLGNLDLIRRLGEMFNLHGLALEDVVNLHQRPKLEEYTDHAFIVTRMISNGPSPAIEQVSMFLGERFLLTFQERPGDCFEPVRARLRSSRGQIRSRQADYLAYALLDAVIDGYFPVLEALGERLEVLEDRVIARSADMEAGQIHEIKRELLLLRRAVWPQREMVNALTRETLPHVTDQTRLYLRDCYDHTIQLMDIVETYREIATGLVDVYLSSVSTRLNEIMKVLTIIATIFIPLGFITGIYGMNFDHGASPWNMPELGWYWGYPVVVGLMTGLALGMLYYFYRKGWILGGGGKDTRR
ncbi:MAG: magnesium/cobalt transporter CorA [Alphaproteobacteria bacterium]|nr:magnesium/cobalt transporter CorA [Alphaproteobacteria bacterium]